MILMLLQMATHTFEVILKSRKVSVVFYPLPPHSSTRNSHFVIVDAEEGDALENEFPQRFVGRPINLEEIPQYVHEYERGNDVEIWKIRYAGPKR